jgi:DNA polymerase-3 subunit alpha
VPILPPCVNDSEEGFTVRSSGLRVGLGRIAGLPGEFIGRLLADRSRSGLYKSYADLESRLYPGPETVRLLARAGALDSVSIERRALLLDAAWRQKLGMRPGAVEMFPDHLGPDWAPPPATRFERAADAFRLLGFTPDHPLLDLFAPWLPRPGTRLSAPLTDAANLRHLVGQRVSVVGLFATGRDTVTAQGRPMQFVTLVDRSGEADISLFPGTCAPVVHLHLGPWLATGVVESQYDAITLTADSFQPLRRPGLEGSINAGDTCALGA